MLTREQLLGYVSKPETRTVACPELGGDVIVRSLTVAEKDRFDIAVNEAIGGKFRPPGVTSLLVSLAICDGDGKRVMTDGDANAIAKWPPSVVTRLANAIRELSGMTDAAVDDIEKK